MYVFDLKTKTLLPVFIEKVDFDNIKYNTIAFGFNWKKLSKQANSNTYALKFKEELNEVIGLLHLINNNGMLIMNMIEVSKKNIGKRKRYDYIGGCLIAFACKQSFALASNYKGFLTFNAKTELVSYYKTKYYAKQINGQRMYIEPEDGIKLINEYINRKK